MRNKYKNAALLYKKNGGNFKNDKQNFHEELQHLIESLKETNNNFSFFKLNKNEEDSYWNVLIKNNDTGKFFLIAKPPYSSIGHINQEDIKKLTKNDSIDIDIITPLYDYDNYHWTVMKEETNIDLAGNIECRNTHIIDSYKLDLDGQVQSDDWSSSYHSLDNIAMLLTNEYDKDLYDKKINDQAKWNVGEIEKMKNFSQYNKLFSQLDSNNKKQMDEIVEMQPFLKLSSANLNEQFKPNASGFSNLKTKITSLRKEEKIEFCSSNQTALFQDVFTDFNNFKNSKTKDPSSLINSLNKLANMNLLLNNLFGNDENLDVREMINIEMYANIVFFNLLKEEFNQYIVNDYEDQIINLSDIISYNSPNIPSGISKDIETSVKSKFFSLQQHNEALFSDEEEIDEEEEEEENIEEEEKTKSILFSQKEKDQMEMLNNAKRIEEEKENEERELAAEAMMKALEEEDKEREKDDAEFEAKYQDYLDKKKAEEQAAAKKSQDEIEHRMNTQYNNRNNENEEEEQVHLGNNERVL